MKDVKEGFMWNISERKRARKEVWKFNEWAMPKLEIQ